MAKILFTTFMLNDYIYLTGYTSSADFPVKTTRVIVNHGNDMFAVYMTKSFSGGGGGFTGGDGELGTPAGVPNGDKGCNTSSRIFFLLLVLPFLRLLLTRTL